MSLEILENKRKRLIFRSGHRGMKEMDLIMGSFAEKHVPDFTPEELDIYEELLENTDPEMYGWITGREKAPVNVQSPILEKLLAHDYTAYRTEKSD